MILGVMIYSEKFAEWPPDITQEGRRREEERQGWAIAKVPSKWARERE